MICEAFGVGLYIPEHGQRQPEQENKLEGEVKGEPVNDADQALDNAIYHVSTIQSIDNHRIVIIVEWIRLREQRKDDPVLEVHR